MCSPGNCQWGRSEPSGSLSALRGINQACNPRFERKTRFAKQSTHGIAELCPWMELSKDQVAFLRPLRTTSGLLPASPCHAFVSPCPSWSTQRLLSLACSALSSGANDFRSKRTRQRSDEALVAWLARSLARGASERVFRRVEDS